MRTQVNETATPPIEKPERNQNEKSPSQGQVRIRSNVTSWPDAWHLVPGDTLRGFTILPHQMTDKQREEMMYYAPCCLCHRTIFQIYDDGCDHPVCRRQGIPSKAEAARRKAMTKGETSGIEANDELKRSLASDIQLPDKESHN
jgi:hypothetical protein